jgi:uncharacterized protein YkwD
MVCLVRIAVRSYSLRLALLGILCALTVAPISSFASGQNPVDAEGEQRMLELINQERARAGVAPLKLDSHLTQAARKHTQRMIDQDSVAHQLPGEDVLLIRLVAEEVRSDHDGENIAKHSDVESAHHALMESPGHRANILNPEFNSVGIGILRDDSLVYVTEDFAHVLPSYSEFEADAAAQQAIADFARSHGVPAPERKTRTQLTRMACDMAKADKIDVQAARSVPGTTGAVAWTASDLRQLPAGLRSVLSQPVTSGYSLGACFAPSKSYPGGIYWLIFITY